MNLNECGQAIKDAFEDADIALDDHEERLDSLEDKVIPTMEERLHALEVALANLKSEKK